MKLEDFIKKYCDLCGSQRCDPKNPELRSGCYYWNEVNKEVEDKNYINEMGC